MAKFTTNPLVLTTYCMPGETPPTSSHLTAGRDDDYLTKRSLICMRAGAAIDPFFLRHVILCVAAADVCYAYLSRFVSPSRWRNTPERGGCATCISFYFLCTIQTPCIPSSWGVAVSRKTHPRAPVGCLLHTTVPIGRCLCSPLSTSDKPHYIHSHS